MDVVGESPATLLYLLSEASYMRARAYDRNLNPGQGTQCTREQTTKRTYDTSLVGNIGTVGDDRA